jgi:hypothetical protein
MTTLSPVIPIAFTSIQTILQRQGLDYPVLIEQVLPEEIPSWLPHNFSENVRYQLSREGLPKCRMPFVLAMRGRDGEVQGVSINYLVKEAGMFRMSCERAIKREEVPAMSVRNVGLAFLLARLQFMKENGLWPESGPVLFNFDPQVSQSYRRRLGIPSPICAMSLFLQTDSISAREGDLILKASPFVFEPALPPLAAASAEAVFVDGRPAR